ncbi:MAG: glycosyltransferase family 4 protein, partial [Planctomycetes bacterium]|nr:glycosyltransferase family 4 protein [Planctomycetota bacterium]
MDSLKETVAKPETLPISRILVACYKPLLSGGLLRFKRFGREFVKMGGRLVFLALADSLSGPVHEEFETIGYEEALSRPWDVTMVPGQGFPASTVKEFSLLTGPNFGYRVQHVLNAPVIRDGFLEVNKAFKPDLVVFNNRHWAPGSWVPFQARKFVFIEGAVDTQRFAPQPKERRSTSSEIKVIGGLAKPSSIEPLLGAMALLPDNFHLLLFGFMKELPKEYRSLGEAGRVRLLGSLAEEALPGFYHQCDCVVHSEHFAGWANLAAEAMACGIPLVCTPHGTLPFAENGKTAKVIDEARPETIASAVKHLLADETLGRRLAEEGRRRICRFNWAEYAAELVKACVDDHRFHYTYAPELGLHGCWPLANRLSGLDAVFSRCRGLTVLDLGSAEGCISRECLRTGRSWCMASNTTPPGWIRPGSFVRPSRARSSVKRPWLPGKPLNGITRDCSSMVMISCSISAYTIICPQRKGMPCSMGRSSAPGRCSPYGFPNAAGWGTSRKSGSFPPVSSCSTAAGLPRKVRAAFESIPDTDEGKTEKMKRHFISYPKSGRTWVRYALTLLGVADKIHFHHDGFEFNNGAKPPHCFDYQVRVRRYQNVDRVIYLSREPKDLITSLYFQVIGRFRDFFGYRGSISDFIRDDYFGAENLRKFRAMWEKI